MRPDPRSLWRRAAGVALVAGLASGLLVGCAELLPVLIDGVTSPVRPPQTKIRSDLRLEIERLKQELTGARAREEALREQLSRPREARPLLPVEQTRAWEEARAILPASADGGVDWARAIADGAVAPRPGIAQDAAEQAVLDLGVEIGRTSSPPFTVTYPHAPHTRWLACGNCHPAIFSLDRNAPRPVITMAGIRSGQHCGRCHGKVAFAVEGNCGRCHTWVAARSEWTPPPPRVPIEAVRQWEEVQKALPQTPAGPDWAKALADGVIRPRPGIAPDAADQPALPINVERVPKGNPVFKVVFPHAPHTAVLQCDNCHPAIFQMAGGANPITMEKIMAGEFCGVCHGTVAFAVATGCPRCHPALAGG